MPRQRGHFGHGRILPQDNLVQRVAVRADYFVDILGPDQITNLGSGVDT